MTKAEIERVICETTGEPAKIVSSSHVSGGCINRAETIQLKDGRKFFVKSNSNCHDDMFECEAEGLAVIAATNSVSVPCVVGVGMSGRTKFLVLEMIESSRKQKSFFECMGRQLAEMHRNGNSQKFGFDHDNYIGSTPQVNSWNRDWCDFWRRQRFEYQFTLARKNGYADGQFNSKAERLLNRLDQLSITGEPPALIHGDLWSGNYMVGKDGQPVLIDPAAYFGHREAEFGMITLFGGFSRTFYESYEEVWPFESGADDRIEIYRLYHLLNHLNLFGSSYLGGCMEIINKYC